MIIFGEKINTISDNVSDALEKRDGIFFKNLAKAQLDSGIVDVIDINVGSDPSIEPDNMRWVVSCIQEALGSVIPLSIDSSTPKTIIAGIQEIVKKEGNFINSITLEENRYKEILPIVKEYNMNLIALPINGECIPESAYERLKIAEKICELIENYDIDISKLYIDCIVQPIALSSINVIESLETIRLIKKHLPFVKTFICLTAISLGLPDRKLINRNFLPLLIKEEIDSIILDPLDKDLIDNLHATNMLLGKDKDCKNYINYMRSK